MFANYLFSDLKNDLTGIVGGVDLAKIQNFNQLVQRAARRVQSKIDPPTTRRKALLTLFQDVFNYTVPLDDDFKYALDLRPQVLRSLVDNFSGRFSEEFDLRKELSKSILSLGEWQDGTQFFRISKSVNAKSVVLSNMDVITGWSVHTDATNLTQDTVNKAKGTASLNFDLDGSTTAGGILNSTLTQVDLSEHDELGSLFLNVFFPVASRITNVDLRWGNSETVYWNRTVTTAHFGSFSDGWNLLRFDWNGATETGTVDPAAIDFARINITYDGTADTDFRVDNLVSRIGEINELWYYSKFLFRTTGGQWKQTISLDDDVVNLDIDSQNILVYECEDEIGKQLRDEDMRDEAREELYGLPGKIGLYERFKINHPSERIKKRGTYYRMF